MKRSLSVVGLLLVLFAGSSFAEISNPGFEEGLSGWETVSAADTVAVVGAEGPKYASVYADFNLTVTPYKGDSMLRLGSVMDINENHNRGLNTVSQTFASTSDTYQFTFRLFSWEHRGDDVFRFDVRDASGASGFALSDENGNPLSIQIGSGQPADCPQTPCAVTMDVGKRGDFLNTDWIVVKVSGLPTDGSNLTVEYSVEGGQNEALGTWAYFDNANTPPVAKFSFPATVIEGDPIRFIDESYDTDPGDRIVSWHWHAVDSEGESVDLDFQDAIIEFPDDGFHVISLTVTDSFGASTTVSTGGITLDQTSIPELWVENVAPIVSALNQEVLAGKEIPLQGRFIDAGFFDSHSGQWDVNGIIPATIKEERAPVISAGIATGTVTAPDTAQNIIGYLTIADNGGAATTVPFELIVKNDVTDRWESGEVNNNQLETAPKLNGGWSYVAAIDRVGDYDIYEIFLPNGEQLPPGSEVLVTLKGMNAPLDLLVLSQLPDARATNSGDTNTGAPWIRTPNQSNSWGATGWGRYGWGRYGWGRYGWGRYGWGRYGWGRYDWGRIGWGRYGWGRYPWGPSPFLNGGIPFSQMPLSELPFTVPENAGIGGNDLELSELGLDFLNLPGVSVAGFSANRGVEEDRLLVATEFVGQRIFVAVVANNGAYGNYSLQVETSEPYDLAAQLTEACSGAPLVGAGQSTIATQILVDNANPQTIFLTQKQRMQSLYKLDDIAWQQFQGKLQQISERADVEGMLVSLPSDIYDVWDRNPCQIDSVNSVSEQIRNELDAILKSHPGVKNIVLVGNDNVVPYHRVKDGTVISNERLYAAESLLRPGTPLFYSAFAGFDKVDDYYADSNPIKWNGRELYVPKRAVARLVETPEEIVKVIDTYIANDGRLTPTTALATGYDFFADGAMQSQQYLSSSYETTGLISDNWTADDLRCTMLGDTSINPACKSRDVVNFNAHFSHFAALPAYGFTAGVYDDIFTSSELAQSSPANINMMLSYTAGCHAGLNVPDNASVISDLGGGLNPNLDFPQAMAKQGINYIASTGYGLGDDVTVAGTERLIALLSDEIAAGGQLGSMLMRAKQRYFNTVSTITDYDVKSSIQTVLYGLPMYEIVPVAAASPLNPVLNLYGSFELSVNDSGQQTVYSYTMEQNVVDEQDPADEYGTFFSIEGDHQATAWRAVQPRITSGVDGTMPVHGALITAATFDVIAGFDPLLSLPKQEWAEGYDSASICLNAYWPGVPVSVNNFQASDGLNQTLIVLPGQFKCASGGASVVMGDERLYRSLSVDLLRSDATDFEPPVLSEVDLRNQTDGSLDVAVTAFDSSGISRIVLLLIGDSSAYSVESTGLSGEGQFSFNVPDFVDGTQMILQVVDGAGNIATWTGGGVGTRIIQVDAGDVQVFSDFNPTQLTATVYGFSDLLQTSGDIFYRWQFGDGSYDFGTLAVEGVISDGVIVDAQGNAVFTVQHQYSVDSNIVASVKITDAFGGVGVDDVSLTRCGDIADFPDNPNLDLIGCGISNSGSNVSVQLEVAGEVSTDMQFRVFLDLQGSGKNTAPDGSPDVKLQANGSSVTGMKSLSVDQIDPRTGQFNASLIQFHFDLSELKWRGGYFKWYAETQDGVAGAPSTGHADEMPDSGAFGYTIK